MLHEPTRPTQQHCLPWSPPDRTAPAIARASALGELSSRSPARNIGVAREGLADPDPMVRIGALDMLEDLPATRIWPLVSPLAPDPVRGVRIRAVSVLADVPAASQPANDRAAFEHAAAEFIAAQRFNADRPEARSTLAIFFAQRGFTADAETEYKAALRLSPQYAARRSIWPIYIGNLAAMATQRRCFGQQLHPHADAGLHHALGLTLTRQKQLDGALTEFRTAAELEPDRSSTAMSTLFHCIRPAVSRNR